jgi:hypothetical protein
VNSKKEGGPGPWENEPDELQWVDPATGYPCRILRNPMGALCGYVGVDSKHPLHKVRYSYDDNGPRMLFYVHGGLTFSDHFTARANKFKGLCFEFTYFKDLKEFWWFGFDCAHHGDFYPGVKLFPKVSCKKDIPGVPYTEDLSETAYKDINYVTQECHKLARQLKDYEEYMTTLRRVKIY